MKRIALLIAAVCIAVPVFADETFDENSLFTDEGSIIDQSQIEDESILTNTPPVSVSFAGTLQSRSYYSMSRDWLSGATNTDLNSFSTAFEGYLLLDVRLRSGVRAYANFGFGYYPMGSTTYYGISQMLSPMLPFISSDPDSIDAYLKNMFSTELSFKEAFLDFNIAQHVYFRLGKQVLQWGRNYFWTPTDLLNVEQKDFFNMTDYREGAMGIKMHIPFGTAFNIYGFIDIGSETKPEDFGVAGKIEFVLGRSEFGLSAWAKKDYLPVYGFDFSSRIWTFDIRGELGISYGDNREYVDESGDFYYVTNGWIPRISVGFTKTFDFLDVSDRIMIVGEFYYNHNGYTNNVFTNTVQYATLMANNLYRMNDHSKYYAALFTTISKFIVSDLTLSLNAIGNLSDASFVVSGGLSYNPVYNFTMSLTVSGFLGEDDKEYTFSGTGLGTQLLMSINF